MGETPKHLAHVLADTEEVAAKVGLAIRWNKCMWQEVVPASAPEALTPGEELRLSHMYQASTDESIRLLGA